MSKLSQEIRVSKMRGAGDATKSLSAKSAKRVPVPSSRKFTATSSTDKTMERKLKEVLDNMDREQGALKRYKSVAEITPTKTMRNHKRPDGGASTVLHATPRPLLDYGVQTPSRRNVQRIRLQQMVYNRMILFVWRRCKNRLAIQSESLRLQNEQNHQLENRLECMMELRELESQRRMETAKKCQQLENSFEALKTEKEALVAENECLRKSSDDLQNNMEKMYGKLEKLKNEINEKTTYIQILESKVEENSRIAQKMGEENVILTEQIKAKDAEIESQKQVSSDIKQSLNCLESQLKTYKAERKKNKANQQKLFEELQAKCKSYEQVLCELKDTKSKLEKVTSDYNGVLSEYQRIQKTLEESRFWWKNAKVFFTFSWHILRNGAILMLPAL